MCYDYFWCSKFANIDPLITFPHQVQGHTSHRLPTLQHHHADGSVCHSMPPVENEAFQEAGDEPPQPPRSWSVSVTSTAPVEEPMAECQGTLSRESSTCPSVPPSCQATKPGLAPSNALDKLGFEPVDTLSRESSTHPSVPSSRQATKPGLAPSAALNKLGFEPVDTVCKAGCSLSRLISSTTGTGDEECSYCDEGACRRASRDPLQTI